MLAFACILRRWLTSLGDGGGFGASRNNGHHVGTILGRLDGMIIGLLDSDFKPSHSDDTGFGGSK